MRYVNLKSENFFHLKEIVIFVTVFSALFLFFFSKQILISSIKNEKKLTPQAIFYIEQLNKILKDPTLKKILLNAYIHNMQYQKALKTLNKMSNFYAISKKIEIYKQMYYKHKKEEHLKKIKLLLTLAFNTKSKKKYPFIYKTSKEFGFINIEYSALKHMPPSVELAKLAEYLKDYDTAINTYLKLFKQTKKNDYLTKALHLALWNNKTETLKKILQSDYNLNKYDKNEFLKAALYIKNPKLVKKYLTTDGDKKTLIQAYLFLKKPKKALELAKSEHNETFCAQLALWGGEYKRAIEIYKKIYKKDKKALNKLYSLAVMVNDYDTLEFALKEMVKNRRFNKIPELTNILINNFHIKSGGEFYKRLYSKYKNPKLLIAAFTLYDTIGDVNEMLNIAKKIKKMTPYIALKISNIYLGKKEIQKSYKILQEAVKHYPNDTALLENYYYLTVYMNKNPEKILKKIISLRPQTYYIVKLSKHYLNKKQYSKAWKLINSYNNKSTYFLQTKLQIAYEMGNYKYVVDFAKHAPKNLKKENFFWYLYINSAKALHMKLKKIYLDSFKYTDFLKEEYYWYLINNKNSEIKNYLKEIHNPKIVFAAYMMLKEYKKAYNLLTSKLKSKNINFVLQKYYLLTLMYPDNEKIKFQTYKKISNMAQKDQSLLSNKEIFDIYFNLALKYAPYYKISKLLTFAKKHSLDYKKYLMLYNLYKGNYDKVKFMEHK